jgi:hypothetical protein
MHSLPPCILGRTPCTPIHTFVLQNLEVRGNKLKCLAGLGSNVAIKSIDATGNEMEVLETADLAPLVNLRKLVLAKNQLKVCCTSSVVSRFARVVLPSSHRQPSRRTRVLIAD